MFYQPASSRYLLTQWIKEILDWTTYDSNDRLYLDEISASEVIDLTYLEGTVLDEAVAANALFPASIVQNEAYRGIGTNSTMSVTFPVNIENADWACKIRLRAALPSLLAVGRDRFYPNIEPNTQPPEEMLFPLINGTQYELQEAAGNRLRALAGQLEVVDFSHTFDINIPSGNQVIPVIQKGIKNIYAYIDEQDNLHLNQNENNLHPIPAEQLPANLRFFYLQRKVNECSLQLNFSWKRYSPTSAKITISLHNQSNVENTNRNNILLSTLILPHMQITLVGAKADFPLQQYADVKQSVISLDEERLHEEAEKRLYQVPQSGCIATLHPRDSSKLSLTTFGVFDTPRETPAPGPKISEITVSPESFLSICSNRNSQFDSFITNHWATIRNILLAAAEAFKFERFHLFQWEAITTGIKLESTGQERTVTIVRAPTGSGKTIVFMVNAAISSLCGNQRSTSILLFPTRILNEDMFRRLTAFVYQMRQKLPELNVTGGLLMGASDPLYRLVLKPAVGEAMYYFGKCPACGHAPLVAQRHSALNEIDAKILASCPKCNHIINYMRNPHEVATFLPDIIIATPDKLFHVATVKSFEQYGYGLFGSPVRYCQICARAYTDAGLQLKPQKFLCNQIFSDSTCPGTFTSNAISKPIRYMGFDEVHSLYGESATYLSVFLSTLEAMQRILSKQSTLSIRYETATATIANETQLLEAITRKDTTKDEIIPIPATNQLTDYFLIQPKTVRYRVLVNMPARISSKQAFLRAVLNSHLHLRGRYNQAPDLKEILQNITTKPTSWDFLLGYVFKKQDGFDLQRSLRDFYRNRYGQSLNIDFLSGEAPKNKISEIIQKAISGQLDLLLANLVISLGIDIQDLNHMIMFGVPKGFTEYVQTAGRTGRGYFSGHVNIILLPAYPRDVYLYRHFHAVLSDVSGYYDALPVKSTNLYCSDQIFGNVAKALLSSFCLREPKWANANGVNQVISNIGRNDFNKGLNILKGGISRVLCNDEELRIDTNTIVNDKSRRLFQELRTQNEFLIKVMTESSEQWLTYSLRGRANNIVRINCIDQGLLDLIGATTDPEQEEMDEPVEILVGTANPEPVILEEENL